MAHYRFRQVDVFTTQPLRGNPLAVVVGADGLSDDAMAAFARWTNLSETTFLLAPTDPAADYRVRIFMKTGELPFAGHPTLGSCHVWLAEGGKPRGSHVIQECGVGLVKIRRDGERLAFAAPPLIRSGAVEPELLSRIVAGLGLSPADVVASQWIDNGPGWVGVMLRDRAAVRAARPEYAALRGLKLGVVGPWTAAVDGTDAQFEVRAFAGDGGFEDPVTGSLNASIAQWLIGCGRAPGRYVASQGEALQRAGRVFIEQEGSDIWVGGHVADCIVGTASL